MDVDRLKKIAGAVRTGGKGTVRRCAQCSRRTWLCSLYKRLLQVLHITFHDSREQLDSGLSPLLHRRGHLRDSTTKQLCYRLVNERDVCRKKKAVHKAATTDDKRLQNTLKRLGVNVIPGIEEVMIMKEDNVIHFTNPKGVLHLCLAICNCFESQAVAVSLRLLQGSPCLPSPPAVCSPSIHRSEHIRSERTIPGA